MVRSLRSLGDVDANKERVSLIPFSERAKNGGEGEPEYQSLDETQKSAADDSPQAGDRTKAERTCHAQRLVVEDATGGEGHAAEHTPDPHRRRCRGIAVEEIA